MTAPLNQVRERIQQQLRARYVSHAIRLKGYEDPLWLSHRLPFDQTDFLSWTGEDFFTCSMLIWEKG